MLEKLHIFVSLIAGICFTIYSLLNEFDFFFWLRNIVIILILFYVLGLITRHYLRKVLKPKEIEKINVSEQNFSYDENSDNNSDDTQKKKIDFSKDEDNET